MLRMDKALCDVPNLAAHLEEVPQTTVERGSVTASRKLKRVWRDNVALIGDASGSVDAITGEGLCLSFHQELALADCLASGNLAPYQATHRKLFLRPALMAGLMLTFGERAWLRRRAMSALTADPSMFACMLAMHVGVASPLDFAANGAALAWRMLTA